MIAVTVSLRAAAKLSLIVEREPLSVSVAPMVVFQVVSVMSRLVG